MTYQRRAGHETCSAFIRSAFPRRCSRRAMLTGDDGRGRCAQHHDEREAFLADLAKEG